LSSQRCELVQSILRSTSIVSNTHQNALAVEAHAPHFRPFRTIATGASRFQPGNAELDLPVLYELVDALHLMRIKSILPGSLVRTIAGGLS
jgi:hypothetical protein